jgi:hypothetical protein
MHCVLANPRAAKAEPDVERIRKPRALVGATLVALLSLASCTSSVQIGPDAVAGLTPDGNVDMNEVQVAYMGSAGGGSGTLFYRGAAYPFSIGGLGVRRIA